MDENLEPGMYAHPKIEGEVYYFEPITADDGSVTPIWHWMIARARGLIIPAEEMARILPNLRKLEFRPEATSG